MFRGLKITRSSLFQANKWARTTRSPRLNRQYSSRSGSNENPNYRRTFFWIGLGTLGVVGGLQLALNSKFKEIINPEPTKSAQSKTVFDENKVFVVFVLGGPGSGKGTQCDRIIKDYNFCHLSAGDLLRAEQQREGSEFGELIKALIKAGKIVPQEITIGLLKNAMNEQIQHGITHFLIDGFPRAMNQARTFEEEIVPSKFTLFFECPEQVMLERLLNRGKTSGRSDDNIESITKRFQTFVNDSMPVIKYFDKAGRVARLQCNQSIDEVYSKVQDTLKSYGVNPK